MPMGRPVLKVSMFKSRTYSSSNSYTTCPSGASPGSAPPPAASTPGAASCAHGPSSVQMSFKRARWPGSHTWRALPTSSGILMEVTAATPCHARWYGIKCYITQSKLPTQHTMQRGTQTPSASTGLATSPATTSHVSGACCEVSRTVCAPVARPQTRGGRLSSGKRRICRAPKAQTSGTRPLAAGLRPAMCMWIMVTCFIWRQAAAPVVLCHMNAMCTGDGHGVFTHFLFQE